MIPIIIQARMGSTRLPGKIRLPWGDVDFIEHILAALAEIGDRHVVVLTPELYNGNENDVLGRFLSWISRQDSEPKAIFRVCADRPFIVPELVQAMIRYWEATPGLDYLAPPSDAIPFAGEIVSVRSLRDADRDLGPGALWREHVTPYVYTHPLTYRCEVFPTTVDTQRDYDLLRP